MSKESFGNAQVQDVEKARHMAEAEKPGREMARMAKERGLNPSKDEAVATQRTIYRSERFAEETAKDIEAIGEPEYNRKKEAIAKIMAENPMATKYLQDRDAEGVYAWEQTPEGKQTMQQLGELVGDSQSLFMLYYDQGLQKKMEANQVKYEEFKTRTGRTRVYE